MPSEHKINNVITSLTRVPVDNSPPQFFRVSNARQHARLSAGIKSKIDGFDESDEGR